MQKIVSIFLIFLLLLSSVGVAISKHYCGEILQTVSVKETASPCCEKEGMPDNCCSDQISIEKAEVLQLSKLTLNLSFSPYILYIVAYSLSSTDGLEQNFFVSFFNSPPITEQEIFILVQSFLL